MSDMFQIAGSGGLLHKITVGGPFSQWVLFEFFLKIDAICVEGIWFATYVRNVGLRRCQLRDDGLVPTLATRSSLYCMGAGRELSAAEIAVLILGCFLFLNGCCNLMSFTKKIVCPKHARKIQDGCATIYVVRRANNAGRSADAWKWHACSMRWPCAGDRNFSSLRVASWNLKPIETLTWLVWHDRSYPSVRHFGHESWPMWVFPAKGWLSRRALVSRFQSNCRQLICLSPGCTVKVY